MKKFVLFTMSLNLVQTLSAGEKVTCLASAGQAQVISISCQARATDVDSVRKYFVISGDLKASTDLADCTNILPTAGRLSVVATNLQTGSVHSKMPTANWSLVENPQLYVRNSVIYVTLSEGKSISHTLKITAKGVSRWGSSSGYFYDANALVEISEFGGDAKVQSFSRGKCAVTVPYIRSNL